MFAIAENPLPSGLDTLVEERIANIGIHLEVFGTYFFNDFFLQFGNIWSFGYLRASLLCIMGELVGGRSALVFQYY